MIGPPSVDPVIKLLDNPSASTRVCALQVLNEMKSLDRSGPLELKLQMLRDEDLDDEVKRNAAFLLNKKS